MTDTPAWLMRARLKARQLESGGNATRESYLALQSEISDISLDRLRLDERRRGLIAHKENLGGLKPDDERVITVNKQIASLTAEIDMLQAAIDDARTRQEAITEKSNPINRLNEGIRKALQAVQNIPNLPRWKSSSTPTPRVVAHDKTAKTLKQIRAEIAETLVEAIAVKNSIRPMSEIEIGVRHTLNEMSNARDQLVNLIAGMFSHGTQISELSAIPPTQLPKHGYGLAISAIGVDAIIAAAKEKAEANDSGALRISVFERGEQLEALEHTLYCLELLEEEKLNGEPRRPNANAAAVLGIPLEVAEEADLLAVKG